MFWAKSPKLRPSQVETQHCQALISSFLGPEGLDVASQAWRVDARGCAWRVLRSRVTFHPRWLAHTWLNICGSQLWFFVGYYFLERCLKTHLIYYIFPDLFLGGQGYVEIISLLQWSWSPVAKLRSRAEGRPCGAMACGNRALRRYPDRQRGYRVGGWTGATM